MGTGSAGSNVTMALRGTVPVTSETATAAAGVAAAGFASFEPQAALIDKAMMIALIRVGMKLEW